MRRQVIVLFMVVALIGVVIYQNYSSKSSAQAGQVEQLPKVGFVAPSFTLQSLEGTTYSYPMTEKKPVVINFWASWCGPCKIEAPELVKLYDRYKGKLEIYAVNLTAQDRVQDDNEFADDFGFTFPVLLDEVGKKQVSDVYQVQAIPTTFFVNSNGIIVDKMTGLADTQALESKFKSLAASK
jgi:cytochrome c biogenesis protein CcmG/thiol:disulfide interchange protein DsbE